MDMARVELNVQAPDFALNDFIGKSVSLSDYQNKNIPKVTASRFFLFSRKPFEKGRTGYFCPSHEVNYLYIPQPRNRSPAL